MSIITINADFKSLVAVLTRIAEALERAYPPLTLPLTKTPAGPETLIEFDPEEEAIREAEEQREINLGIRQRNPR